MESPHAPSPPSLKRSWFGRLLRNEWFGLFAFLAVLAAPLGCIAGALALEAGRQLLRSHFAAWYVEHDADAKQKIRWRFAGPQSDAWPASAHDFHYYKSRGIVGDSCWWTMRCGSVEECRKALAALAGERRGEIRSWKPLDDAEPIDDPAPDDQVAEALRWDVNSIRHGEAYRDFHAFYAIDLDAMRVYGFHQSR